MRQAVHRASQTDLPTIKSALADSTTMSVMSERGQSSTHRNMNKPHVADHDSDDDDDNDERIIKIRLDTTSSEGGILSTTKAITFGLKSSPTYHLTDFAITASMICTPGDGDAHGLRIITRPTPYPSEKQTEKTELWQ
jgi:hypothetical protein